MPKNQIQEEQTNDAKAYSQENVEELLTDVVNKVKLRKNRRDLVQDTLLSVGVLGLTLGIDYFLKRSFNKKSDDKE